MRPSQWSDYQNYIQTQYRTFIDGMLPLLGQPSISLDAPNENLRLRHFVNGISTTLMAVHGLAQA